MLATNWRYSVAHNYILYGIFEGWVSVLLLAQMGFLQKNQQHMFLG